MGGWTEERGLVAAGGVVETAGAAGLFGWGGWVGGWVGLGGFGWMVV